MTMDRRWIIAGALGLLLGATAGWFAAGSAREGGSAAGEGEPLYWVAPMDPGYRRDAPGKSPMGMDLVPVYETQDTDARGVRVSPTLAHNFGVRLATVVRMTLDLSIDTLGTVALADPQIEHIHPRIAGWIERLVASSEGDRVNAGQVLLELYSPALVRAQKEFLVARGSGEEGLVEASRSRLRALGMSREQIAELAERGRTRERIALVDVGGKQILIGVTPQAIRTLHVFDEPVVAPDEPVSGDFARKLQGNWKTNITQANNCKLIIFCY
jgi:Cu(I)/Ag(I) efflux system membrane fusion protein